MGYSKPIRKQNICFGIKVMSKDTILSLQNQFLTEKKGKEGKQVFLS